VQNPKALALVAIPFQFAAAHALGYGLATHVIAPGSMQMAAILIGNTIGITAIGFLAERLLNISLMRRMLRVCVTAVACIIGFVLVSGVSTHRYNALALPIVFGVSAFQLSARYANVQSPEIGG
jgi:hypothetical protein